ncbi:polysaccharide pyruvyl transferase family protein [Deltaproteobacteria bacterium]|nr:polysaccharide pyruvyl transferase family protein [Deltaproteobacteria bacterium]
MPARRQFALFGAAPDTGNRGVSALFRCVLEGIGGAFPDSRLWVFDNGSGVRSDERVLENEERYRFTLIGARGGRRYYAPENLATTAAFSRLGRSVGGLHPSIRVLDQCDALLDVSGGDSFSDIYGGQRFWAVTRPKLIAKRRGIPLVLMPQTYGPFRGERTRRIAREAVLSARIAWARDRHSFRALKVLLGSDFDESLHREGVDMAFNLRAVDPGETLGSEIRGFMHENPESPLIGLNVSGLIALDPHRAKHSFGLRASYLDALDTFIRTVMQDPDLRLLLVPHVMTPPGSPGSDEEGCLRVLNKLPPSVSSRIRVTPTQLDECEVKWLISKLDWFCGTRMHSTIAALSSGVPTAAIAYSDKTLGVFESCGVENEVIDPRELETEVVAGRLIESYEIRDQTRQFLSTTIGGVKARAAEQLRCTIELLNALA